MSVRIFFYEDVKSRKIDCNFAWREGNLEQIKSSLSGDKSIVAIDFLLYNGKNPDNTELIRILGTLTGFVANELADLFRDTFIEGQKHPGYKYAKSTNSFNGVLRFLSINLGFREEIYDFLEKIYALGQRHPIRKARMSI